MIYLLSIIAGFWLILSVATIFDLVQVTPDYQFLVFSPYQLLSFGLGMVLAIALVKTFF